MTSSPDILRHVVLLGLKAEVTADETAELVRRFAQAAQEIPGVEGFEWGANCSHEGLGGGLTHAFVLTFASPSARDAYLPHPAHLAFAEWSRSFVDRVIVVDYEPATGVHS